MNPFTPNFGQIPRHIAGRIQEREDILYALDGNLGSPARTSILIGARGCGKTALLAFLAEESQKRGWISVNTSCVPGIQEDIIQQTILKAEKIIPREKESKMTGITIGPFAMEWENKNQLDMNWRTQITRLLDKLEESDTGLFLTIDEVDPGLDEMIQIASIYQLLIRENRKIALLMAGLPSQVSSLLNDRSVSFLRRASQYHLSQIEEYEVRKAFEQTLEEAGKTIDSEALSTVVKVIDGYPYMMQLVGYRVWDESSELDRIGLKEAIKGINLASKDFENRVLRATVRELSDGDLRFLEAMLPDEGPSNVSDIEKRMNKTSGYVSTYRRRLIEAGIIEMEGRGKVKSILPGLKEYIKKQ